MSISLSRVLHILLLFATVLLAPCTPHSHAENPPSLFNPDTILAFNGLDSSLLTKDDDEVDEDEELDEEEEWRRKELRDRPIGKIEIDHKRPEYVVVNVLAGEAKYAFATIIIVFGLVGFGIYRGSKQFQPSSASLRQGKTANRARRNTSAERSPRKRVSLSEPYAILGVDMNASDEEIRNRFRHLAKSFHSDKLANHDLPEEIRKLSEEQFIKIKAAYEQICAARKME